MIPACAEVIKAGQAVSARDLLRCGRLYPEALAICLEVAGSDERVLYGSDYPHNIGDMRGCLARVNALAPASAKRIAGKNAEKLFGL